MQRRLAIIGTFITLTLLMAACIAPVTEEGGISPMSQVGPDAAQQAAAQQAAAPAGEAPMKAMTTPELIEAAFADGTINAGERILYLAYAVYEPDALPEPYASDAPWRGTQIVQEIKRVVASPELCALSPAVQSELRRLIQGAYQCS